MNEKEMNMTHNQHYVPQVYLDRFSNKETNKIYYYDRKAHPKNKCNGQYSNTVENICHEYDIYEVYDKYGNIVAKNINENWFRDCIENHFNHYYSMLQSYNIRGHLSEDEKSYWTCYIIIQILRHPYTINGVCARIEKYQPNKLNEKQIRNLALHGCIPSIDKSPIFYKLYNWLINMNIHLGIDSSEHLMTGDYPVYVHSLGFATFCVSPNLCLFWDIYSVVPFIIRINEIWKNRIMSALLNTPSQYIYSNKPFTGLEIQFINNHLEKHPKLNEVLI